MGRRSSWSARLAEFQHEDIDRFSPGMRMGVSCIPGNVEEIAVINQFESGRLDLRPDQRFIRTVQRLSDARARTRLGRVIANDQLAARLQPSQKALCILGRSTPRLVMS